jgi:hypothetical protein
MRFFVTNLADFWPKVADNEQLQKMQCWKTTRNFSPGSVLFFGFLGQKKFTQLAATSLKCPIRNFAIFSPFFLSFNLFSRLLFEFGGKSVCLLILKNLNLVAFLWRLCGLSVKLKLDSNKRRHSPKKFNQTVHQFSIHSSKKFTFSLSSEIFLYL